MARRSASDVEGRRRKPATTPEAREQELAASAYDLAEEQIKAGTASSQVMTHFLKMGSTRERLEQERMRHEVELMEVKREAIQNQARTEELMVEALNAMKSYSGSEPSEELEDAA